jgi:hypothetical protein
VIPARQHGRSKIGVGHSRRTARFAWAGQTRSQPLLPPGIRFSCWIDAVEKGLVTEPIFPACCMAARTDAVTSDVLSLQVVLTPQVISTTANASDNRAKAQ